MAKRKQATVPLGIIISTKKESGFGHGDNRYFKITGDFVSLADGKVRNMVSQYETINGNIARVDGLKIVSQGDEMSRKREDHGLYGFDVRYEDVMFVERRDALAMALTLTTIEKRLTKMYDTRGQAKTFGEFVGRVAEATKATQVLEVVSGGSWHHETEYRYRDIGDAVRWIDSLVNEWQHPKEEVTNAQEA